MPASHLSLRYSLRSAGGWGLLSLTSAFFGLLGLLAVFVPFSHFTSLDEGERISTRMILYHFTKLLQYL